MKIREYEDLANLAPSDSNAAARNQPASAADGPPHSQPRTSPSTSCPHCSAEVMVWQIRENYYAPSLPPMTLRFLACSTLFTGAQLIRPRRCDRAIVSIEFQRLQNIAVGQLHLAIPREFTVSTASAIT
jgi:hypothetical protein